MHLHLPSSLVRSTVIYITALMSTLCLQQHSPGRMLHLAVHPSACSTVPNSTTSDHAQILAPQATKKQNRNPGWDPVCARVVHSVYCVPCRLACITSEPCHQGDYQCGGACPCPALVSRALSVRSDLPRQCWALAGVMLGHTAEIMISPAA